MTEWEHGVAANVKLHDYLGLVTTGDALRIVEAHEGQGLEAWRQLKLRYNPTGGRYQLDQMTHMLKREQCKDLSELPAMIDKLEKDIRLYEQNNDKAFPEEWKIPLLRDILPTLYKKEIEMKFTLGAKDYSKMAEEITNFANETRVTKSRGYADMDVDTLRTDEPANEYTDQEWTDYLAEGAYYESIDYMGYGKAGKGGKKGGKRGKGNGGKEGK